MINRDFTRSGKEYIKQNKVVLITLAIIAIVGIIMMATIGFNGSTDIKGYTTFSAVLGEELDAGKLNEYKQDINEQLAESNCSLYSVQITGQADKATLVVKYAGSVKDEASFNQNLAKALNIEGENTISEHKKVDANITSKDYIYTVACGLIIVTILAVYVGIRYNIACAISSIAGSGISILLLLSLASIFRLSVSSTFLAINIITLILVGHEALMLFDGLEKERETLKDKNDRGAQMSNTIKKNALRKQIMFGSIFAICLLLVFVAPSMIKQTALTALFAIVVDMFVAVFAMPFVWNLTITKISDKIRVKKDKKVKVVESTDEEGELENRYTENQVIEVKEDDGRDNTPSSDDNITVE